MVFQVKLYYTTKQLDGLLGNLVHRFIFPSGLIGIFSYFYHHAKISVCPNVFFGLWPAKLMLSFSAN